MTLHIPHYENAHVLVVGDVMLDRYWNGTTSRISPEAPVPVVHIQQIQEQPGAAANVALNVNALGGQASLLSLSGDDVLADILADKLTEKGISCHLQRIPGIPTISKIRVLSLHQQLLRLDFEESYFKVEVNKLLGDYRRLLPQANVIVLSDYAKGTLRCAPELIRLANEAGIPIFVDPKGNDYSIYRNATLLTPNRKEFEAIVGICATEEEIVEKGLALIKQLSLQGLLVTRGEQGMTLLLPSEPPLHLKAKRQEVYDVTGAGDTVIGILAASVAAGLPLASATVLANLAAGLVVTKLGAATVSVSELRRALQDEHNTRRGVYTEDQALLAIKDAHAHGEKVVMTNGCFDILHPGHIAYLQQARQLGDHLLVAINDDDSVRRLKGNQRPINSLSHRMAMLAGLASVDWIVAFNENTPSRIINKLLPDVLVKGGDYQIENIVGAQAVLKNGGEVKVLPFLDGFSTTNIIEKVLKQNSTAT